MTFSNLNYYRNIVCTHNFIETIKTTKAEPVKQFLKLFKGRLPLCYPSILNQSENDAI